MAGAVAAVVVAAAATVVVVAAAAVDTAAVAAATVVAAAAAADTAAVAAGPATKLKPSDEIPQDLACMFLRKGLKPLGFLAFWLIRIFSQAPKSRGGSPRSRVRR